MTPRRQTSSAASRSGSTPLPPTATVSAATSANLIHRLRDRNHRGRSGSSARAHHGLAARPHRVPQPGRVRIRRRSPHRCGRPAHPNPVPSIATSPLNGDGFVSAREGHGITMRDAVWDKKAFPLAVNVVAGRNARTILGPIELAPSTTRQMRGASPSTNASRHSAAAHPSDRGVHRIALIAAYGALAATRGQCAGLG